MNALKLCCEELKDSVFGLGQGEIKLKNKIDELQKLIKKIQDNMQEEGQKTEKKFNQIKLEIMNLSVDGKDKNNDN